MEYICDYGDCTKTLPSREMVKVTLPNDRIHRFCCVEHAIKWLEKRLIKWRP